MIIESLGSVSLGLSLRIYCFDIWTLSIVDRDITG